MVFGEVLEGLEVLDAAERVKTDSQDKPQVINDQQKVKIHTNI